MHYKCIKDYSLGNMTVVPTTTGTESTTEHNIFVNLDDFKLDGINLQ